MKQIYHDEECIASALIEADTHILEMSKLACQKVATLRLSYLHEAYKASRGELSALVKRTLLSYVSPDYVLQIEKFFELYNDS